MGCVGPKSLISVRSDHTFLDLTVEQIEVSFMTPNPGSRSFYLARPTCTDISGNKNFSLSVAIFSSLSLSLSLSHYSTSTKIMTAIFL